MRGMSTYLIAQEALRLVSDTSNRWPGTCIPLGQIERNLTRDEFAMDLDTFSDEVLQPMLAAVSGHPRLDLPDNCDNAAQVIDNTSGLTAVASILNGRLRLAVGIHH